MNFLKKLRIGPAGSTKRKVPAKNIVILGGCLVYLMKMDLETYLDKNKASDFFEKYDPAAIKKYWGMPQGAVLPGTRVFKYVHGRPVLRFPIKALRRPDLRRCIDTTKTKYKSGFKAQPIPLLEDPGRDYIYCWVGLACPWLGPYKTFLANCSDANFSSNCLADSLMARIHRPQFEFFEACKNMGLNFVVVENNRTILPTDIDLKAYQKIMVCDRIFIKQRLMEMKIPYLELPSGCVDDAGFTPTEFRRVEENGYSDDFHPNQKFNLGLLKHILKYVDGNYMAKNHD